MTDDWWRFFSSLLIATANWGCKNTGTVRPPHINMVQSLLLPVVTQICSIACVWRIASDSGICDRSTTDKCAARFWASHSSRNDLSNRRSNRKANLVNNSCCQHPRSVKNLLIYHPILIFLKVCVLLNIQGRNYVVYLWLKSIQRRSKWDRIASVREVKNISKGCWITARFKV